MQTQFDQPQMLPVLSRGKHRNPRRGACFMELASYLAGERWSDHPRCTHPLLAHMARLVNDCTGDDARPRLALLIPSVIGLTSTDRRWDHELSVLAAATVLPDAPEPDQRALAVGMLTCERLAMEEDLASDRLVDTCRDAEAQVPLAMEWAWEFIARHRVAGARHHPGPAIMNCAVPALAQSCVPDPDERLHALLTDAVALCEDLAGRNDREERLPAHWDEVCSGAVVPVR